MSDDSDQPPRRGSDFGISDSELRTRQFTTSDPEGLENLSLSVPDTSEPPTIEFYYDLTPPKGEERPFIRCAHCKVPKHWRGYVMRCVDGRRFLVGIDCGAKIYGADFNLVERDFEKMRDRQLYLHQLDRVRAAFPELLSAMTEIRTSEVFEKFLAVREALEKRAPHLFRQLRIVALRNGGALTVEERIRDYAAEERRAERQKHDADETAKLTLTKRKALRRAGLLSKPDDQPIYQIVPKPIGQLAGAALFDGSANPQGAIGQYHGQLQTVFSEVSEKNLATSRLKALFRQLRDIVDGMNQQLAILDAVPMFFSQKNLETVSVWASRTPACNGDYRALGGGLAWRPTGGGTEARISGANGYSVPRPAAISAFRLALTG